MTTTSRKKAGRNNETATPKSTRRSIKAVTPVTSLSERSPEERWQVIAVAAYHKAEKRGFAPGHELGDWIEAETEMDSLLFG